MDEAALLRGVGARVRKARAKKGWSQERLAFAAELDRSFLSQVETGSRNVSVGKLLRLARALDVAVRDLVPPGR